MMLKELLDGLVALGANQSRCVVHSLDDHDPLLYLVQSGETLEYRRKAGLPRAEQLKSLQAVISMAQDPEASPAPEVFVGYEAITLVHSRASRRSSSRLRLEKSDCYRTLLALEKGAEFSPSELLRFLRFELPEEQTSAVRACLAKLDFVRRVSSKHAQDHKGSTMGRAVEAETTGERDIPRDFAVNCRPFRGTELTDFAKKITVGIEIDAACEKIYLRALCDEVFECQRAVIDGVFAYLRSEIPDEIPVYRGDIE